MMQEHEEFEVETDRTGEPPMPFWSETIRGGGVAVGRLRLALPERSIGFLIIQPLSPKRASFENGGSP